MFTYGSLPITNGRIGRKKSEFAVIGFPSDLGATSGSGQDSGVAAIIARSEPLDPATTCIAACGVLPPTKRDNNHYVTVEVAETVSAIARRTGCVVAIGGDDSISYGVVLGLKDWYPDLAVMHYDAHSDMSDDMSELDHSNWVSFVRRLNIPVKQWGQRVMGDLRHAEDETEMRPLVVVVDMDVIDPAYAPGVAVPYPFGCTPNELWDQIKRDVIPRGKVVGIVLTEVVASPYLGANTAHLACVLLARLMSLVHTRS